MFNGINERLDKVVKHYNLSNREMSLKLGFDASTTHKIINSNGGISLKYIQSLLENYPDINARWFITGEGEMFIDKPDCKNCIELIEANTQKKLFQKLYEDCLRERFVPQSRSG